VEGVLKVSSYESRFDEQNWGQLRQGLSLSVAPCSEGPYTIRRTEKERPGLLSAKLYLWIADNPPRALLVAF